MIAAPVPARSLLSANLICAASMMVWAIGLPAADLLIGKMPALTLAAARMGIAAIVLLPLWALVEGPGALRRAPWLRGTLIGGATIGLGAFTLVVAQDMTDVVTVAVISAGMPVIGIALEVVLDRRRLTPGLIIGLILSCAGGVMALVGKASGLSLGLGAALCLLSVFAFTLGSRLTVTAFPALTPLGRTTVTLTGAAVATGALALAELAFGGAAPDWAQLGWTEFGALVLFGIGGLAISQVLWIYAVGRLGIGMASLHINLAPFYVMIILVLLGGAWNNLQALGAVVVGLGVLVAQGLIPLRRAA